MLKALFRRWETRLSQRDTNRRVQPFEWGTEFLANGESIDDPRSFLIRHSERVLRNSDDYYSHERVDDYRLEGHHLTFTSPVRTQFSRNNTVHGWFFPTDSSGRVVLVLPQWNADSRGHLALARMMNWFGISALRLSLPYHDLRMPEDHVRADYMLSPNLGRTIHAVRQAVVDCRAALDWLESRGYSRIAILGTSLGSCIALITLAHDRRLSHSVQNHVSPYFADVVWTGISTRHVRQGMGDHIDPDTLRRIWMPISPKAYLKKLVGTGQASLLVHARYDHSFLPRLSDEVLRDYRELGLPHSHFRLYCGHYTSGEFPFNIVLGYAMCEYLRRNL